MRRQSFPEHTAVAGISEDARGRGPCGTGLQTLFSGTMCNSKCYSL